MKTIREILKEQSKCCEGKIQNTLQIIDAGFPLPWMHYYMDEECKYVNEIAESLQTGEHFIYKTKEKQIHVY